MTVRTEQIAAAIVSAALATILASTAVVLPDLPEPPEDGSNHSGQYYYGSEQPPAGEG
jgi:hypothetical protein